MEVEVYKYKDTTYKIIPILDYSYINTDVATVEDTISDTPIEKYIYNMLISVDQNLAFSVIVNNVRVGFVYSYLNNYVYTGASIHIHYDIVSTIIALKTIFDIQNSHKLVFIPHVGGLYYFKSMATELSIKAYYYNKSPLVVIRDNVYTKGEKIYNYLGITQ